MQQELKQRYRRKLPHIHPPGETVFVTFRLSGSLPREFVRQWREENEANEATLQRACRPEALMLALQDNRKRAFAWFDAVLDGAANGPVWLLRHEVACVLREVLYSQNSSAFEIRAFCIMPNHVHLVVTIHAASGPFHAWVQRLKGISARDINLVLHRKGRLWQREYFDYVVRNAAELQRVIRYVLENPVKAGLCSSSDAWPFSYRQPEGRPPAEAGDTHSPG